MAFRLIYITFAHKFGTEMKKLCDYIAKWMGLMVLLVAALSVIVPASFVWIDTWAINPMLGVIMFGMGLTLSPHDFKIVLSRPKDILIGCLAQFTVMPLLAFGLTWAFSLPKELALGVILVGCCPGGTASNVITYLAKGDLALSVGMTATSTLLAPVLTPLLVWLMAGTMVVGIVVSHNADRLLVGGLLVVIVVMAHNLLGLSIGYIIGRLLHLQKPKCVALSIEVGMQNSGLASSLAVLHFAAFPLATIPGAIFSVWHNISGALVAKLYQRENWA